MAVDYCHICGNGNTISTYMSDSRTCLISYESPFDMDFPLDGIAVPLLLVGDRTVPG